MLTVLVLVGRERATELISRIESIPEVCVLSHTHDSSLALARARVLLPDALVIDVSAPSGDADAVVHRARGLGPASEVILHADGRLPPDGLVRTLTRLARDQHTV
ncbi:MULTISPECIES: hypothetical protein [unclassified Streptomyces]|uniref:hypothetical protein n=1 Tax=unclassified Streptomyces TaxID=2593676 RepID=UPI00136C6CB1|nr:MULTISPECIES: hypothetical protein [unclassified Streptomyces]MYY83055.1 hypothetical protein [Streptomyces sp. SID335]NDZ84343.1 hypothetical protein [Streptomyces sp. SID10115]NEB47370.1 hypothetical protein [Streptomyces sp. SID339]